MNLDEIFRPRTRVNVFANKRIDSPSCIAMIAEGARPTEGMTLVFDEGDLIYAELKPGDAVQIGFGVVEAGMYFTSDVTVRSVDAFRVHVSTPGLPYKWPRRTHGRAPAEWPCTVSISAAQAALVPGTTINIAAAGALLALEDAPGLAGLGVGAAMDLVLSPPDRPPLECTAKVVRVSGGGELGRVIVAVRFIDLPEPDEMKLQLLVLRATARRYLRCRVAVPCELAIDDGVATTLRVEGVSENMSGNGVLLIAPSPPTALERGQRGALAIRLKEETVVVKVVEVIRIEARGESLAMALKYVEIDREQRHAIVGFVFERVRDV